MADRLRVLVSSPLLPELAARIAAADERVELLFEPELLPPVRFQGDISGPLDFELDPEGEERWRSLLAQADVLYGLPGNSGAALARALAHAPEVGWVQARNAGAGQQLGDALAADPGRLREVTVTSASGIHARPLAEFSLLGLLAFAQRLPTLQADKAARRWPGPEETPVPVRELLGQTAVVLGLGAIGAEFARLASLLGLRVLGVRRRPGEPPPGVESVHPPEALASLAPEADALVVTTPLTSETRGLVDARVLDALPARAVVVNVGRGAVLDEAALAERLADGRLAGAALDVFATEPLPPESPLWGLPNVLIAPHAAALTPHEDERAVAIFIDNLGRRLAGRPLRNVVDPDALY